ncbi:MAG: hypothetical protein LBF74_13575 [Treponema sp.]|jgi:hypothetical protein|nr:hypothetical protein [Treponema sp.]
MEKLRMGVLDCSKQYALRADAPLRESLLVDYPLPNHLNMFDDIPGKVTVAAPLGGRLIETGTAGQYLLDFDAFADALFAPALSGTGESVIRC